MRSTSLNQIAFKSIPVNLIVVLWVFKASTHTSSPERYQNYFHRMYLPESFEEAALGGINSFHVTMIAFLAICTRKIFKMKTLHGLHIGKSVEYESAQQQTKRH